MSKKRSTIANKPEDSRHGTVNGYANLRCRCDACREAWRIYYASVRRRYRARPWPTTTQHGTYNAYANYGCRCGLCRAANSAYARDYYRRKKAATT